MSENVVGLHDPLFKPAGTPDARVITHLEAWLAAAKRGEIDGIAVAASKPNGKLSFNYCLGPGQAAFRVIAAVSLMDSDIGQVMNDRMYEGILEDIPPPDPA